MERKRLWKNYTAEDHALIPASIYCECGIFKARIWKNGTWSIWIDSGVDQVVVASEMMGKPFRGFRWGYLQIERWMEARLKEIEEPDGKEVKFVDYEEGSKANGTMRQDSYPLSRDLPD